MNPPKTAHNITKPFSLEKLEFKKAAMELLHKPKWASCLMETVQMDGLMHHCPLNEEDKKEIRK